MERKKWETAIRCLEVALHPNTTDDEVIAGVNGFRRTADGTPLSAVCLGFAGRDRADRGPFADLATWREKVDRLSRENLDLRRKLTVEESSQKATILRLREAEQRVRDLNDELWAAQRRAGAVERQFADLQSAHAETVDRANRQKFEPARRDAVEQQAKRAAPPFQKFLEAARHRADQAETVIPQRAAALDRGRDSNNSPSLGPSQRAPWTA